MRPNGRICIKVVMGATKLGSIFNAANDAVEQSLSKTSLAQMRSAAWAKFARNSNRHEHV